MPEVIDFDAMTTEQLGQYRSNLKARYIAERSKTDEMYRAKVLADRLADAAKALGLPEGASIVVAPPPVVIAKGE